MEGFLVLFCFNEKINTWQVILGKFRRGEGINNHSGVKLLSFVIPELR